MQQINGKIAFGGIAIGKIKEVFKENNVVRRVKIDDTQAEISRFRAAKNQATAKAQAETDTKDDAAREEAADSEDAESTDDSGNFYKDGTYTGSAQGFGGAIEVQVTLKDDEITDIQVMSASGEESAYLSQAQSVINSIISAQSTDVDTVSGATFSSTGIINAVVDALGKAENE